MQNLHDVQLVASVSAKIKRATLSTQQRERMECCTPLQPRLLPLLSPSSHPVFSSPLLFGRLRPSLKQHLDLCSPRCHKMFVPGFGEASPESQAARSLQNFFTFVAVKIVLAQLESYNPEAYAELNEFLSKNSLNDGEKFCSGLMRESPRHKALALRILEVRSAYAKKDFEWENLEKLAFKMVDESNTRLMREYVLETSFIEDDER